MLVCLPSLVCRWCRGVEDGRQDVLRCLGLGRWIVVCSRSCLAHGPFGVYMFSGGCSLGQAAAISGFHCLLLVQYGWGAVGGARGLLSPCICVSAAPWCPNGARLRPWQVARLRAGCFLRCLCRSRGGRGRSWVSGPRSAAAPLRASASMVVDGGRWAVPVGSHTCLPDIDC